MAITIIIADPSADVSRLLLSIQQQEAAELSMLQAQQAALGRIESKIDQLVQGEQKMAGILDSLTAEVANQTTVEQSAVTLIQGMAQKIQDLINNSGNTVDPTALQALVDQMKTNDAALAAAVSANTPAAQPPAGGGTA